MKIEKLNDNQIRCTLTHADLADRQLKISELVCGSEKAKSLFHDMMRQASSELGFEAEDMPLMIEAVPTSSDCIVLIITKVDDPEELDSKFSKFGSSPSETMNHKRNALDKLEGAEELLNLLEKVKEAVTESQKELSAEPEDPAITHIRLFSFGSLDGVIHASKLLNSVYHDPNTLYKDVEEGSYVLALTRSEHSVNEFNKICNMLSEYSSSTPVSSVILAFLEEHCEVIISQDAVKQLGNL